METIQKTYIADNLKVILDYWNINQDDLGERLGLKRGAIYSYKISQAKPSVEIMLELSKMTKMTIQDLWLTPINRIDLPERPYGEISRVEEPRPVYARMQKTAKPLFDASELEQRLFLIEAEIEKLKGKN